MLPYTGAKLKPFSEMNLDTSLVEALKRMNFINSTEVQEQVIPVALQGKDVIVRAKTGTGKTAAFLIPIRQMSANGNDTEALIIVPTRELALQIAEVANKLRHGSGRNAVVVYGGASINVQMQALSRNPNIVIGTPGRIIDLMERRALNLNKIRFLVLDEADTMFDMGFIEDIEFILSQTPKTKQTLLFSATMPEKIITVARRHMHDISIIKVGSDDELVVTRIKHYYTVVDNRLKFAALLAYIKQYNPKKAIIFVQTKFAASALYDEMRRQGFDVAEIHGGLTQAKREHSLREFKVSKRFLIATNVAARGIDISGISDIISFDIPDDPHTYIHRVGRSARMDADGRSFTIASTSQIENVKDLEYIANIHMEKIGLDTSPFQHISLFRNRGREGFRSSGGYDNRSRGYDNRPGNGFRPIKRNENRGYRDNWGNKRRGGRRDSRRY